MCWRVLSSDQGARTQQTGTARKRVATEAPEDPAPRTTRRAAKASGIMASAASEHAVPATPRTFHKDLPFTPAASKGQNSVMGTCMRLPRRGESILNARGSPMGVRETDASAQVNAPAATTKKKAQTTETAIRKRGAALFDGVGQRQACSPMIDAPACLSPCSIQMFLSPPLEFD